MGDEAGGGMRMRRPSVLLDRRGAVTGVSLLAALALGCASERDAVLGSMGGGGAAGPSEGQGGASGALTRGEEVPDCSDPASLVAPSGCHRSYFPCVPPDGDVNCGPGTKSGVTYVEGPICVLGDDPHGLDRDKDGIGCE